MSIYAKLPANTGYADLLKNVGPKRCATQESEDEIKLKSSGREVARFRSGLSETFRSLRSFYLRRCRYWQEDTLYFLQLGLSILRITHPRRTLESSTVSLCHTLDRCKFAIPKNLLLSWILILQFYMLFLRSENYSVEFLYIIHIIM